MDRNDPQIQRNPNRPVDAPLDQQAPGYAPNDDVVYAPREGDLDDDLSDTHEHGNEAVGAGAGVLGGAAIGMAVGGPPGAVVGGAIGGVAGAVAGEALRAMTRPVPELDHSRAARPARPSVPRWPDLPVRSSAVPSARVPALVSVTRPKRTSKARTTGPSIVARSNDPAEPWLGHETEPRAGSTDPRFSLVLRPGAAVADAATPA